MVGAALVAERQTTCGKSFDRKLIRDIRAERAIHEANPPDQGRRTDRNFALPEGEVLPRKLIRNIRAERQACSEGTFGSPVWLTKRALLG